MSFEYVQQMHSFLLCSLVNFGIDKARRLTTCRYPFKNYLGILHNIFLSFYNRIFSQLLVWIAMSQTHSFLSSRKEKNLAASLRIFQNGQMIVKNKDWLMEKKFKNNKCIISSKSGTYYYVCMYKTTSYANFVIWHLWCKVCSSVPFFL